MKEHAFSFGIQAEIIQEGPAAIPEQYASGPDTGDAGRKIGIPATGHEPCFKALRPGFPWGSNQPGYDWGRQMRKAGLSRRGPYDGAWAGKERTQNSSRTIVSVNQPGYSVPPPGAGIFSNGSAWVQNGQHGAMSEPGCRLWPELVFNWRRGS